MKTVKKAAAKKATKKAPKKPVTKPAKKAAKKAASKAKPSVRVLLDAAGRKDVSIKADPKADVFTFSTAKGYLKFSGRFIDSYAEPRDFVAALLKAIGK